MLIISSEYCKFSSFRPKDSFPFLLSPFEVILVEEKAFLDLVHGFFSSLYTLILNLWMVE